MNDILLQRRVAGVLDEALALGGRAVAFTAATRLLGDLPELDSFAVVRLVTRLQETFAIAIDDDEIDGAVFATVGSLTAFVAAKAGAVAP